jgi:hypothetical protein
MSQSAVQTLWRQTSLDEVDTKEYPDPYLHLVDNNFRMSHLAKEDAAIERMAWAIVIGLLFTVIRLVGAL